MTAVALAFPDDGDDQTPPGAKPSALPMADSRPEAQATPPAITGAKSIQRVRAGSQHGSSQESGDAQGHTAAAAQHDDGQDLTESQALGAVVELPAADQGIPDTHTVIVDGAPRPPAPATLLSATNHPAPVLVDPFLKMAAEALDDLERTRIANENRARSLRQVYGLGDLAPAVIDADRLVAGINALEHQAELSLKRTLRKHPLGPWVARTIGVGEKQAARLLAAIDDPYWNSLHDRPRLVSELWAYCGYHVLRAGGDTGQGSHAAHDALAGVAPARARGQKANWSADAKMRVWLIACSCIKQAASPYRTVYDQGREKYADALHQVECRRCGPTGHPAAIGSPLSAGYQHARALRLVSKAILRDLWLEAHALHDIAAGVLSASTLRNPPPWLLEVVSEVGRQLEADPDH